MRRFPRGSAFLFCGDGKPCSDIFAGEGGGDLAGLASVEDGAGDAGGDGELDGFEFGFHAADGFLAFVWADEAGDGGDVFDFGDAAAGGVLESVDAGEDDEVVGADELGDFGGESVVVSEAEFLDGDGVVFVDDGDDGAGGKESVEGIPCVGPVHPAVDVAVGEEELGDVEAVGAERCGVEAHEFGLAGCSAGLLAREVVGPAGEVKDADAGSDGGAADEDAGDSAFMEGGNLACDAAELRGVEGASA